MKLHYRVFILDPVTGAVRSQRRYTTIEDLRAFFELNPGKPFETVEEFVPENWAERLLLWLAIRLPRR